MLDADIKSVWDCVTDNAAQSWRSGLAKVEITGENTFEEVAENGFVTRFAITEKEECRRYAFDMENARFTGRWAGVFRRLEEGKTELTVTESLQMKNPLMRFLAKFLMNLKGMQLRYIEDLKAELKRRESEGEKENGVRL